jgi:hypothetical protein
MVDFRSGTNTGGQNPSTPDGLISLRTLRLLNKKIRQQIKMYRCKTQAISKDNHQLQHKNEGV